MKHNYRIMVPTTMYNAPAPAEIVDLVRVEIKLAFAKAFGGYTEVAAMGGYVAESGELIEEPVYAIEACCEELDDAVIGRLADLVKTELDQESVMIIKDHEATFV